LQSTFCEHESISLIKIEREAAYSRFRSGDITLGEPPSYLCAMSPDVAEVLERIRAIATDVHTPPKERLSEPMGAVPECGGDSREQDGPMSLRALRHERILTRQLRALALYRQQHTLEQIAEHMGVAQGTAANFILEAERLLWRDEEAQERWAALKYLPFSGTKGLGG
jgi:hypothetical protein